MVSLFVQEGLFVQSHTREWTRWEDDRFVSLVEAIRELDLQRSAP